MWYADSIMTPSWANRSYCKILKAARVILKVKYEDTDVGLICQLLIFRGLIKLELGIFMYKSKNNLLLETAGKFHIPAEKVH